MSLKEFGVGCEHRFNLREKLLGQMSAARQVWKVRWVGHSTANSLFSVIVVYFFSLTMQSHCIFTPREAVNIVI